MLEFVIIVIIANLIMLAALYLLRHVINIRAPVLFLAVGISILYCLSYPFLAARVPYPQVVYLYTVLVLAGAGVLYIIESRILEPYKIRDDEMAGMSVGEALAAVGGIKPSVQVTVEPDEKNDPERMAAEPDTAATNAHAEDVKDKVAEESVAGTAKDGELEEKAPADELVEEVLTAGAEGEVATGEAEDEIVAGEAEDEEITDGAEEKVITEEIVGEQDFGRLCADLQEVGVLPHDEAVCGLIVQSFDCLAAGDSTGAVEGFFEILKLKPSPELALKLCTVISSVYLAKGYKEQALSVMEMLKVMWGPVLDENDLERMETTITS
jgi:hypothetical protein